MGAYLSEFQFEEVPPTEEEFRSHFVEMYSVRCLDSYEVEGTRVLVTCLLGPCGVHYVRAVMQQLGGRPVRRGEPLDQSLPDFVSMPWRRVRLLTKIRVYARWLAGKGD